MEGSHITYVVIISLTLSVLYNPYSSDATQEPDMAMMQPILEDLKLQLQNQTENLLMIIQEKEKQLKITVQNHEAEISKLREEIDDLKKKCHQKADDNSSHVTSTLRDFGIASSLTDKDERRKGDANVNGVLGSTLETLSSSLWQPMEDSKNSSVAARFPEKYVTFYATLSHNASFPTIGQPIIFDQVVTNLNGPYNRTSGMFHCGITGIYVFHVHLLSNPNKVLDCRLMKNENEIAYIYSGGRHSTFDNAGTTAIVELGPEDRVWLKAVSGTNLGHAIDNDYSSFSGFLLYSYFI